MWSEDTCLLHCESVVEIRRYKSYVHKVRSSRRVRVGNDTLVEGRLPYQKRAGEGQSCMQHVVIDSSRGDYALPIICVDHTSMDFQLSEWSKHTVFEDYRL